jgi:hypothetical protein
MVTFFVKISRKNVIHMTIFAIAPIKGNRLPTLKIIKKKTGHDPHFYHTTTKKTAAETENH